MKNPPTKTPNLDLSEKAVISRQRERVASGIPLQLEDSETIGDKYTHASWGMCSREAEAEFPNRDNLEAPDHPYKLADMPCPMRAKEQERGRWGCFYSCRLFKHRLRDRTKVLEYYDQLLESLK